MPRLVVVLGDVQTSECSRVVCAVVCDGILVVSAGAELLKSLDWSSVSRSSFTCLVASCPFYVPCSRAEGRLAIKCHPDKNRDDPHAEERFKEIAIAYQTLSDPELRRKYNEFGSKESAPEGGFVDPEEIFGTIFGGERFLPIIGHISLAKDMKAALQEEEGGEEVSRDAKGREILSPEEKAKRDEKQRKQAAEVSLGPANPISIRM